MSFKAPKYTPPAPPPPAPNAPVVADSSSTAAGQRVNAGAFGGLDSTILTGAQGDTSTAQRDKKRLTGQ